jgi:cyanate lyase
VKADTHSLEQERTGAARRGAVPRHRHADAADRPADLRFYELVMVNGPAWKALIEEEFGDGIMSAIDLALQKDAPLRRTVQRSGAIVAIPILAGLHHQYVRI